MPSLRERNRLNAMRLTQRTAMKMFLSHGFDNVTVGDIADEAGMAASTIYRHFATKEGIVLWDEHDPAIEAALVEQLERLPPFRALREAFVETIGERYSDDVSFQLQRIKFIYATSQLHAAAVEADFAARDELADGLRHFLSPKVRAAAPIIAGAAMLALDVAMDRWQAKDGKKPLGELIAAAFDQLEALPTIA
ncbi:MAG: TetR/AcrR family transcriptional regulator [Acidimicrobiales bacterium]